jgi:phosphoribosylanthranilate isomerase
VPIRCKLCGIRSSADLEIAVQAGADAVGFICGTTHVSEDALDESAARELADRTPPYVSKVLVTHLEEPSNILELADLIGVDTIQLHGLIDIDSVAAVFDRARRRTVIKVVHVTGPGAIDEARSFLEACDALQLDSRTADRLGGTGEVHDWSISRQIVETAKSKAGLPVILSGGLRPANLADAIASVQPYAVDVNSGIENERGDKASGLTEEFVSIAHSA